MQLMNRNQPLGPSGIPTASQMRQHRVCATSLRVQFKKDPFSCMESMQHFLRLPHFEYRAIAKRNAAGYWVVGKSKSSQKRAKAPPLSSLANATLHAFYERSQRECVLYRQDRD